MKNQVFNPYLPLDVYIPDGEPHVFGDRVYVFGSHDKEGGNTFCMLDYEVWSAPVDDLSDWHCEGVIYRAEQDPDRDEKRKYMYAPDVVRGNDGRYYLYYALAGGCFTSPIHVAVCDTPAGKYEYYGSLRNPDGSVFDRKITFDPGLINDGGTIRLYYGWAMGSAKMNDLPPEMAETVKQQLRPIEMQMFGKTAEQLDDEPDGIQGAFTVTLDDDMLTVTSEPIRILPGQLDAAGTQFEGHAFFEASSIRKIGDTYCFIYSSQVNHELCCATSQYPDKDFRYGGVLISNGDIGYKGRKAKDRLAITGNNHGSIENIGGEWYIFYHRHTNKTCYSRQGCAEKITINPDGTIPQVEMTSCGLNPAPLLPQGSYPAVIACNLTNGKMPHIEQDGVKDDIPCITCRNGERIIADISDGTLIGYKYFQFDGGARLTLCVKGNGKGRFIVKAGDEKIGSAAVRPSDTWWETGTDLCVQGVKALFLIYEGEGKADLKSLSFQKTLAEGVHHVDHPYRMR